MKKLLLTLVLLCGGLAFAKPVNAEVDKIVTQFMQSGNALIFKDLKRDYNFYYPKSSITIVIDDGCIMVYGGIASYGTKDKIIDERFNSSKIYLDSNNNLIIENKK